MSTQPGSATTTGSYVLNRDRAYLNDTNRRASAVLENMGFITQHLCSGMRLLDCGCGNGALTLQLAKSVAPAEIVGLDSDEQAIERRRLSLPSRPRRTSGSKPATYTGCRIRTPPLTL